MSDVRATTGDGRDEETCPESSGRCWREQQVCIQRCDVMLVPSECHEEKEGRRRASKGGGILEKATK